MKRTLHCRRYGRYVDDFYVVSADREWLLSLRQPITVFLRSHLGLDVNTTKTCICDVRQGVEFLGAFLKPRRRYVSNATLARMEPKVRAMDGSMPPQQLRSRLNSMLGLLSHYRCYRHRCRLFMPLAFTWRQGYFLKGVCKYVLKPACIEEKL